MHRQHTKFSSRMNRVFTHRANRVAKAIERQGIRATYELHDRLLSNRSSRDRFRQAPAALDDVQQSILSDVRERGFSVQTFGSLFPEEHWHELVEQRDRFVASTEADLAAGGEHVRVRPGKEFVVRLRSYGVELGLDDPWFRAAASHRLLDLANAYLEMWSKLAYVDVWYSVPQPAGTERISSQRWHRDYDDQHLQNYPSEEQLEARVPPSAVQTFTGPAGTLVFCNTAGFHRGGFSTTNPRVLATATYSSPASLASLTVQSYTYTGALDELDGPTQFALS
jgi:hypothetical protein